MQRGWQAESLVRTASEFSQITMHGDEPEICD